MSQKLQELTEKLYREGVEKARAEAETIIEAAERKRREIIEEAEREARQLVEKGRKEAEQLYSKGESELKLAARQASNALKQSIVGLLSHSVLSEGIGDALGDKDFIRTLIESLVSRWTGDGQSLDFELVLPEEKKEELEGYLKSRLAAHLERGLEIVFEDRFKSGFRILAGDGSYMLSFTERDFEQYFQSFVKERTRALLFAER